MENSLLEDEPEVADVRIPMTKAEFLNWHPDEGFLYEYDGEYAEQIHTRQNTERYFVRNIQDFFIKTSAYQQRSRLFEETECWLTEKQMRRPDMALFTDAQIRESTAGGHPVPTFVVEIISEHDKANKIEKKVGEYFRAGVQVVWHIYPELRMVRVLLSPRRLTSLFESDVIDAAPAIPDLQMTIDALFTD